MFNELVVNQVIMDTYMIVKRIYSSEGRFLDLGISPYS